MARKKPSVEDENFYVVQGWMRNFLNLKGLELQVYAIVYGFSQSKHNEFTYNTTYLIEWTGCTKRGIQKVLQSLENKGLIIKIETENNNIVKYKAISKGELSSSPENPKGELSSAKGELSSTKGELSSAKGELSSTTHYNIIKNILSNNKENNSNNISADKSAKRVEKSKSLSQKPTLDEVMGYIYENRLKVDEHEFYDYYESNGWKVGKNQMKDWQAAIRNWHRKAVKEQNKLIYDKYDIDY